MILSVLIILGTTPVSSGAYVSCAVASGLESIPVMFPGLVASNICVDLMLIKSITSRFPMMFMQKEISQVFCIRYRHGPALASCPRRLITISMGDLVKSKGPIY